MSWKSEDYRQASEMIAQRKQLIESRLRRLAAEGLTVAVIVERLGLEPKTVRDTARRLGITLRKANEWDGL